MADARTPVADGGTHRQPRQESGRAPCEERTSLRTYFTRRCVGLHLLVVVLVPTFLLAGWWQYNVARSGNDLSWVYTVEWPFFAVYAIYVWWKLIHDKSTPFDRLWAAKRRAAADEAGTPLYQIPGWATDKELSRAVHAASNEARHDLALPGARAGALTSGAHGAPDPVAYTPPLARTAGDGREVAVPDAAAAHDDAVIDTPAAHDDAVIDDAVIDANVVDVKVVVDEALEAHDAYNRFLFELSRKDPPKRWTASRRRTRRRPTGM